MSARLRGDYVPNPQQIRPSLRAANEMSRPLPEHVRPGTSQNRPYRPSQAQIRPERVSLERERRFVQQPAQRLAIDPVRAYIPPAIPHAPIPVVLAPQPAYIAPVSVYVPVPDHLVASSPPPPPSILSNNPHVVVSESRWSRSESGYILIALGIILIAASLAVGIATRTSSIQNFRAGLISSIALGVIGTGLLIGGIITVAASKRKEPYPI